MTNYTIIDNNIITSSLSKGSFHVYCLLTSMCFGEKAKCFPSQKYISEKLHKSISQVQRYIKELVDTG